MKLFLCALFIALASAHDHGLLPTQSFFDYTKCCNVEKSTATTQYITNMNTIGDECISETGDPKQGQQPKFACFHVCLANKTNAINADGSLNEAGFRSVVTTQMATEDYQKTAADGIATSCIAEVKAIEDSEDSPDGCSTIAMKALHCAAKGFLNACPAAKQDTDEHCVHFLAIVNGDFKGKLLRTFAAPTTASNK